MTEKISKQEARQGRQGIHVAIILTVGLVLAVTIGWLIFL